MSFIDSQLHNNIKNTNDIDKLKNIRMYCRTAFGYHRYNKELTQVDFFQQAYNLVEYKIAKLETGGL